MVLESGHDIEVVTVNDISRAVDDTLNKIFIVKLQDVSATVEDIIIKAPVTMVVKDTG